MAIGYGVAAPKPEPLKRTRARKVRKDASGLKVFRDAVWDREREKFDGAVSGWARCQRCDVLVTRDSDLRFGEVDHIIPRSLCMPAQRHDPTNGRLLCRTCHRTVQEHRDAAIEETTA